MDNTRQQVVLLLLLLAFYCAVPLIFGIWAVGLLIINPSHKVDEGVLLSLVKEISSDPGLYTNTIHQMILPVVAAITAASHQKLKSSGWLFMLPLITIFVCIADALILNVRSTLVDERAVTAQFFISMASNLAVYVMMLVGLRLGEAGGSGNLAADSAEKPSPPAVAPGSASAPAQPAASNNR